MTDGITLEQSHGIVTADSREVAEHFQKQHGHILRDIDQFRTDLSNFGEMFFESSYRDVYSRSQRCFRMTRDGFSLLVMGFTGSDALQWKVAYIQAFNAMERRIVAPPTTAEHLLHQAQLMVETERRLTHVETGVRRIAETMSRITAGVAPLGDGWQAEAERRIQTTCQQHGLDYRDAHTHLYRVLESNARCDLNRRVMNRRQRLAQAGATRAAQDAVSRLAVIADDPDLRAHFERILQDWTLRAAGNTDDRQLDE